MTLQEVIETLNFLANPEVIEKKRKKFGITTPNSLGIHHSDLKVIAKDIGKNQDALALELFDTGIYEGMLLCSKIYNPKNITRKQMEKWIKHFDNWEICDSFCMGFFAKSEFALEKIEEWTIRKPEFEKRAGFAIMAAYGFANKEAENSVFENFIPILKREATDERLYVKKAINWALRNIGKRNQDLREIAIETAKEILEMDSKAAKWIAKDALRELNQDKLNVLDYPRSIYR